MGIQYLLPALRQYGIDYEINCNTIGVKDKTNMLVIDFQSFILNAFKRIVQDGLQDFNIEVVRMKSSEKTEGMDVFEKVMFELSEENTNSDFFKITESTEFEISLKLLKKQVTPSKSFDEDNQPNQLIQDEDIEMEEIREDQREIVNNQVAKENLYKTFTSNMLPVEKKINEGESVKLNLSSPSKVDDNIQLINSFSNVTDQTTSLNLSTSIKNHTNNLDLTQNFEFFQSNDKSAISNKIQSNDSNFVKSDHVVNNDDSYMVDLIQKDKIDESSTVKYCEIIDIDQSTLVKIGSVVENDKSIMDQSDSILLIDESVIIESDLIVEIDDLIKDKNDQSDKIYESTVDEFDRKSNKYEPTILELDQTVEDDELTLEEYYESDQVAHKNNSDNNIETKEFSYENNLLINLNFNDGRSLSLFVYHDRFHIISGKYDATILYQDIFNTAIRSFIVKFGGNKKFQYFNSFYIAFDGTTSKECKELTHEKRLQSMRSSPSFLIDFLYRLFFTTHVIEQFASQIGIKDGLFDSQITFGMKEIMSQYAEFFFKKLFCNKNVFVSGPNKCGEGEVKFFLDKLEHPVDGTVSFCSIDSDIVAYSTLIDKNLLMVKEKQRPTIIMLNVRKNCPNIYSQKLSNLYTPDLWFAIFFYFGNDYMVPMLNESYMKALIKFASDEPGRGKFRYLYLVWQFRKVQFKRLRTTGADRNRAIELLHKRIEETQISLRRFQRIELPSNQEIEEYSCSDREVGVLKNVDISTLLVDLNFVCV